MINLFSAEVRAAVIRVLSAHDVICGAAKRADEIVAALYAPRTRLREVVAPSGSVYRVSAGVLEVCANGTGVVPPSWWQCGSVPPKDCAVVADLQARPTEEVPSEDDALADKAKAESLDAKRYQVWRYMACRCPSAAARALTHCIEPDDIDAALDKHMAVQP